MNFYPLVGGTTAGPSDAEGAIRHLANLRALDRNMLADQRADNYLRAERGLSEGAVEDLPAGAGAPVVAGMPTQAPAATFATTPVPDAQRSQYVARNVTPQVTPNQSDAESKRLASKAPPKPGVLEQIAAVTTMPGALAVGPGQYMSDADRFAELKRLNPAATTGGNESMAEANRLLSKGTPTAAAVPPAAPAPAGFDALAQAVKMVESAGDPNAVSPKGAVGTMQTMPGTLRDPGFGVRPAQNNSPAELERVGRDYLQAMIAKYPGNLSHALAAYNWGPGNTDKWIAAGADPAKLPAETRAYIPKVMARLGGQTPVAQAPAAATTQTAAAPDTQAPASAGQAFSPEQVSSLAAAAQNDLRIRQLQLTEINRLLSVAPDAQTARQLREKAQEIRFGAFNAQLTNASAQALGGDERALSQLATAARVQYAQTPQGFVAVALGADGQYRPTTQPMSRERFINTLYSEASGAAAKARAAQQAASIEAQKQIAIEGAKTQGALLKVQAEAQTAIQKAIIENKLTQGDIVNISRDPMGGPALVYTKRGVFTVRPGEEVNGMMMEPELVPLSGLAG